MPATRLLRAMSWGRSPRWWATTSGSATPISDGPHRRSDWGSTRLLDEARASHQQWIVAMFGTRLPATPAARRRAVQAVHAATDVYTWKLLRRDLRLSRTETERIIVDLVVGVLEGDPR